MFHFDSYLTPLFCIVAAKDVPELPAWLLECAPTCWVRHGTMSLKSSGWGCTSWSNRRMERVKQPANSGAAVDANQHWPSPACPPLCAASSPPASLQPPFQRPVRRHRRENSGRLPAGWCIRRDEGLSGLPEDNRQFECLFSGSFRLWRQTELVSLWWRPPWFWRPGCCAWRSSSIWAGSGWSGCNRTSPGLLRLWPVYSDSPGPEKDTSETELFQFTSLISSKTENQESEKQSNRSLALLVQHTQITANWNKKLLSISWWSHLKNWIHLKENKIKIKSEIEMLIITLSHFINTEALIPLEMKVPGSSNLK